jgi:hypothetical protein
VLLGVGFLVYMWLNRHKEQRIFTDDLAAEKNSVKTIK